MKKKSRHISTILLFLAFFSNSLYSQQGFSLPDGKKGGKLKFELVNNLVIIPIEINDVKLSFILDTGVTSTLLFGATKDTLELKNTRTVKLRGLGKGEAVDALKSDNNILKVGEAIDYKHSLYTVFDANLNFSSRMGVPIHGILGYDFFNNFVVSINYITRVIKYVLPENFQEKKSKRYVTYPLLLDQGRPFINNVSINGSEESLMLIDIGSSDSFWVFDDDNIISENTINYFPDFLGLGLNGSIYGKRSRVKSVSIGQFSFQNVNVAIPESNAIVEARIIEGRKGSLGANIMKRFKIIFNYPKKQISLKKNSFYNDPFHYNMSGLTIAYSGITLVKTKQGTKRVVTRNAEGGRYDAINYNTNNTYDITFENTVIVEEVRENSSAAMTDVRIGDKLLRINGKYVHEYKLYEIVSMFSSKEGKLIKLTIDRGGEIFKKKFYLKKRL